MKAPPFHTQARRVELARQHLKAAGTLLEEARLLHRCDTSLGADLARQHRDVCAVERDVCAVLGWVIDNERRQEGRP